jgi:hypothetical protein
LHSRQQASATVVSFSHRQHSIGSRAKKEPAAATTAPRALIEKQACRLLTNLLTQFNDYDHRHHARMLKTESTI